MEQYSSGMEKYIVICLKEKKNFFFEEMNRKQNDNGKSK